ncbi:DUF4079 domain-containing protein [Tumidithrix elongata RA019]|uniref:DUF4079 domain-containing protein n=1 Tax=Tumidithrix elongata BACA0141 TaxID=2716417 RepID=A0AAW9PY37_9CYAN|nr:DUF4079 domain-containing protein [Tumidithrix elongata RA019]
MTKLTQVLQPIANQFEKLGTPEPIVHWGHPFFMAIVIFIMGSYVGYAGWRSRIATDPEIVTKSKADHRKLAPFMSAFLAAGYTGGLLSLVMQDKPLLESPHFWTGSTVLILLSINATLSLTGFAGNKAILRTIHAYVGSAILVLLFVHAALGLKLGLAI